MRLAEAHTSPMGLLRLLLALSALIPVLLFVVAGWLEYQAAFADVRQELLRSSEVAREHAAKVFDGQSQFADRVTDLVRGMDTSAITRSEKTLHEAFATIVARVPQVQSVLLVERNGRPLVSAGTYPVPDVDLRERDYFKAVIGGHSGTYVSSPQLGMVNRRLFFGLARPWLDSDGTLKGVVDVAVLPSAFQEFYRALLEEGGGAARSKVLTLVRNDGQMLVRYPPFTGPPPKIPVNGNFLNAIRLHPDEGVYEGRSVVDPDAPTHLYAYRAVQGYPVYVVAGRSRASIVADWRRAMESHLAFGIPATLALVAVTWTALARTRREEQALDLARQEIERRQQAEATLLRAQRLEAVGQITGGVAHDFNNLLTIILGSADMIRRRAEDPAKVRLVVEQILVAARRGGEITQKLLAFSGHQSLNPETVDLNRRLTDFKPLLDRAAREAVEVDLDLGAELDAVSLDPGQFEAAVLNLVGNARDAMSQGGRVVISTRNIDLPASENARLPAGRYVRVAVADSGTGMDPETEAKAFEPFFTTKGVGKGTGLGLSQVYGFVRQAGGEVRIATGRDRGTTVEIILPRTDSRPAAEQPAAEAVPPAGAPSTRVVLAVEDEPGVLDVAIETLRELGYVTVTATSARAALDRLRGEERIDLLFSDVVMPGGMNGAQLAMEARRLRPDLPVLLTSGYVAEADRGDLHAIPLLMKPYDRAQLADSLRAILRPARLRGVAEPGDPERVVGNWETNAL